jgi:beta-N-acetylhexosaminidase
MPHNHILSPNQLKKKIYQLIISRLDGQDIDSGSYKDKITGLVKKGIGGFIVFGGGKDKLRTFIDKLQSLSEIPLFIASDVERGVGQQVAETTLFPCQMAMAAAIDKEKKEDIAVFEKALIALTEESKDTGINMPLIPVLDINQNPDNPIICTRAFSDNPEDVIWFGSEYIRVIEEAGLISCAKHFPGHGDTSIDSHISLPVINKSCKELMDVDVRPFRKAIKAGVSSIMVGHLSIPAIDPEPASISKRMITNILREELGFKGLVMTDALNMNALKDRDDVLIKCISAGADVLLHPVDPDIAAQELISAVESNIIPEKQIDSAVHRVVKTKEKISFHRKTVNYSMHERLSMQVTEMSITMVKNSAGILPLSPSDRMRLIFSGDRTFFKSSPLASYFKNVSTISDRIDVRDETALFAVFTSVSAWRGSSGIDEAEKDRMNEIIKKAKNSVVISFGSPYVLRHFYDAGILVAAYEPSEQAQKAVIRCLKGELEFRGKLPVRITWSEKFIL